MRENRNSSESSLERRLLAYSAIAGVALAVAPDADAQVVYNDVDPDETIAATDVGAGFGFFLDIDGDGTDDLRFVQSTLSTFSGAPRPVVGVYGIGTGTGFQAYAGAFFNYANAADAGATIDGNGILGAGGTAPGFAVMGSTYGGYGAYGPWAGAGQTDKYLGIQFVAGGGTTHYAWVRLDVAAGSGAITLKDFAFQSTPNTAIAAGDEGDGEPPPPPPPTNDIPFSGNTVGGETLNGRPFTVGDGTAGSCSISGTGSAVPYQAFDFTTDTDGDYIIGMTTDDPDYGDTYILLYEGTFDPNSGCVDLIALDDDDDGSLTASTMGNGQSSGRDPLTLDDGQTYTIVVTGFANDDAGEFDGTITAPEGATITFGDAPPPPDGDIAFDSINLNGTTVPTEGDVIRYKIEIVNNDADAAEVDIWAAVAPTDGEVFYVRNPRTFTVPGNSQIRSGYNQRIPGYVPDGTYIYTLYAGEFNADDPSDASGAAGSEVYSVTKGIATLLPAGEELAIKAERATVATSLKGNKRAVALKQASTPRSDASQWQENEFVDVEVIALDAASALTVASGEVTVAPNPIRNQAQLGFAIAEEADVSLAVYDLLGREVAGLLNERMEAGTHSATLDVTTLPAGTYVYRLMVGTEMMSGRLTVVR